MHTRQIALFGKSAKQNNFCVSGIDIKTKKYIRPISENPAFEDAVPRSHYVYEDGSLIQDFDIVEIRFKDDSPDNIIQPENLYYDENFRWRKIKSLSLREMVNLHPLDIRDNLFYNSERSVSVELVQQQSQRESLLFVLIKNLYIRVEMYDRPKFYATFSHNHKRYWRFSLGDIKVRNLFQNHEAGEYFFKERAIAVLSLTNPYYRDNKCYKMLAQVF